MFLEKKKLNLKNFVKRLKKKVKKDVQIDQTLHSEEDKRESTS